MTQNSVISSTPLADDTRRRNRKGIQTRQRVLDGAVACLNQFGYAGSTVDAVMQETGLSRGSVLNQFPTRNDMMVAVSDYVMHRMIAQSKAELRKIPEPVMRVRGYFDIILNSANLPEAMAMTELLLAARWDKDLAEGIRPVVEVVEAEIESQAVNLARKVGIQKLDDWMVHVRVMILSVRGVKLEMTFDADRKTMLGALKKLRQNHEETCDRLLSA